MQIPQSFKDAISDAFYDKTVTLYQKTVSVAADGHARIDGTSVVASTFTGHVHFDNFEKLQEQYGIREEIAISITTDTQIATDSIIGYDGKQYYVFKVIEEDSHYLLIGRNWSSKSSISISV